MLITCYCYYGCLLSNISTYHLKVASRPVNWEQWNGQVSPPVKIFFMVMFNTKLLYPPLFASHRCMLWIPAYHIKGPWKFIDGIQVLKKIFDVIELPRYS